MRGPEAPAAAAGASTREHATLRLAAVLATRLAERPRLVLAALVVVHWLALVAFALTIRHNGRVFYQGGDQMWYTTSASLIADGHLPPTYVGFGWVLPLIPVAWFTASDYVAFIPAVVVLNALVLAPVALACVYGIASRLGGRLLGLWAAGAWVVAPYLAIPFFRGDYHGRYVEQFLPQALGFTALADYPSMVCLLVAAYLLVRALDAEDWTHPALAGLAAGFAATIKPANLLFLAGPAALLLLGRRFRLAVPYAAALVPPLLLLVIWKVRGLGNLPFALEQTRVAAGATLDQVGALGLDRYVHLDWEHLQRNLDGFREFFWSERLVEWVPIAGAVAVARRSIPVSGLLAGWLAAFVIVKGTAPQANVESGSFFRLLMPAFPAYFLLFAALPLLVPGVVGRIRRVVASAPPPRVGRRTLVAAAVGAILVPLVVVTVPRRLSTENPAAVSLNTILTPVTRSIDVHVRADGARRILTWTHRDYGGTAVFFRVFRTAAGGEDVDCVGSGAAECRLQMLPLASTREPRFVDLSPPPDALYRVGVATNWKDDPEGGDVIALSPPIPATP